MPAVPVSDDLLIQALNLVEEYGSGHNAVKAGVTDLTRKMIDGRATAGRLKGLKPTIRKDAPRVYTRQRIGKMHLVIPDTQVKPGVCTDHMEWIGNYIVEKKPDVIIHLGDHWDMESLSAYDKGRLSYEGRRYIKDVKSGQDAMERLLKPMQDYNRTAIEKYKPQMEFCMGNHEHRILRMVDETPGLEGKCGLEDLQVEQYGWHVNQFLEVVHADGIQYSHYFVSGPLGRPVSSAAVLMRERQRSATMGHVQKYDLQIHPKTQQRAMFAGTCYLHDEKYLGPQGNSQRRQIIVKNEVEDGCYDLMEVSLEFLKKAYS